MALRDVHALEIHDAERGVGAATVDCPRRRVRMPMLVCEACDFCVHASRPDDPNAWLLICTHVRNP